MSDEQEEALEPAERPGRGKVARLAAVGVVLYGFGYLSLRFKLAALGVSTDLGMLDERYLFAGAKFLVTLATTLPNLILLIGVTISLLWGASRLVPRRQRQSLAARGERLRTWWSDPTRLALTGIVLSLGLVQFVMRKCFLYSNLLLAPELDDDPFWPRWLLLRQDVWHSLFFAGLVAGTAVTTWLLVAVHHRLAGVGGRLLVADRHAEPLPRLLGLRGLQAFLVAMQLLFLPINHGVLMAADKFPRVADPEGQLGLKSDGAAWLVYEGPNTVTYVVSHGPPGARDRRLVTLRSSEVKKIEIIGYDSIMRTFFLPEAGSAPPARQTRRNSR